MDIRFEEYLKAVKKRVMGSLGGRYNCHTARWADVQLVIWDKMVPEDRHVVEISKYYNEYIAVDIAAGDIVGSIQEKTKELVSTSYEDSRAKLRIRLDGKESRFRHRLHVRYLDFAATFYMQIESGKTKREIIINKNHLLSWGVSGREIYSQAVENEYKSHKWTITRMDEAISSQMVYIPAEAGIQETEESGDIMLWYVVSNEQHRDGANALLMREILGELEGIYNGSFMVLPVSLDEFITMPCEDLDQTGRQMLSMTMHGIFEDNMLRGIELTDTVYYYDCRLKKLLKY